MQVVYLAGGKGTRLAPLTDTTPKPMTPMLGAPFLEHSFKQLPDSISGIVVVTGHLDHVIKEYFGAKWNELPITYAHQDEQKGTLHALKAARAVLDEEFLVLLSDVYYAREDLEKLVAAGSPALLAGDGADSKYKLGSICRVDENFHITDVLENRAQVTEGYMDYGACTADHGIFSEPAYINHAGEELLAGTLGTYAKKKPMKMVLAKTYATFSSVEEIPYMEKHIKEHLDS